MAPNPPSQKKRLPTPGLIGLISLTLLAAALHLNAPTPTAYAQPAVAELLPTDDAYVVADLNDPADRLGFRNLNSGELDFLKTWYAWNVTPQGERLVSIVYLKFDLSGLDAERVESAVLRLRAVRVDLTAATRPVDLHPVDDVRWSERSLNFNNAPIFSDEVLGTVFAGAAKKTYEWNVTQLVQRKLGSQLSFAITLKTLYVNSEEQVVFASKEGNVDERPRLIVVYTPKPTFPVPLSAPFALLLALVAPAAGGAAFGYYLLKRSKRQRRPPEAGEPKAPRRRRRTKPAEEAAEAPCPSCGGPIQPEFAFCPRCGQSLRPSPPET